METLTLLLCLGMIERIRRGGDLCGLDSGSRTTPTWDNSQDFIRTIPRSIRTYTRSIRVVDRMSEHMSGAQNIRVASLPKGFSFHGAAPPYFAPMGRVSS